MSNSAEKFAIEWDQLGLPNKGSYCKKSKTGSSMFFYVRDALCIPDGTMINQIKTTDVSDLGKLFRKSGHHLPGPLINMPDDFFQSLEESEREYDRNAIISMWESIGIKFSFKSSITSTSLIDVLNETMDIIIAPVIVSHKDMQGFDMQGFSVKVCIVSNSKQNIKNPTTAILYQNWPIKWQEPCQNPIWTVDKKDTAEPFAMNFRLSSAYLRPDLQSMLTALAQSLSYNGCIIHCCRRIDSFLENISFSIKDTRKILPRYEWYEYDHKTPEPIAPLEPEIVRDFVNYGDRRIRLEHAVRPVKSGFDWEKDSYYLS